MKQFIEFSGCLCGRNERWQCGMLAAFHQPLISSPVSITQAALPRRLLIPKIEATEKLLSVTPLVCQHNARLQRTP